MSKIANQDIELFRAGDYTAQGKGVFTEADVQQIVDNYDPAQHEAPIVIGHSVKDGSPAFGWLQSLQRVGNVLKGRATQVNPAFEEAAESGAYKKRSVELYKGPKGWALRRVAFLGAQPPEIKGLANIQFEAEDKEAIEIEFSEESHMEKPDTNSIVEGLIEGLRSKGFLPAKKDDNAKQFSEDDVKRIATEMASAAVAEALKPLEAKFSERDTALATAETKSRAAAAIAKVKAAGAWVPAFDKLGVAVLFDELATKTEVVEFGEGDAKEKKAPLDILISFMEASGKIVPTGRVAEGQGAKAPSGRTYPENADPNSVKFSEAARAYAAEKNVSIEAALDHVARTQPELTRPGGATAGQV